MIAHGTTRAGRLLVVRLGDESARLVNAWPHAARGEAEALRRVRVATRRLRTLLVVFADPDRHAVIRRTLRELRAIGRALGRSRELLVARDDLARAARAHDWARGDEAAMERWLDRRMAKADRDRRRDLRQIDVGAIAERLAAIAAGSAPMKGRVSDVLARRADQLVRARAECGIIYEPDRLHAFRLAVKKFRYALEAGSAMTGADVAALVGGLKRLQRRWGRLHDRQVLLTEIRACGASGSARQARTMDRLAADLETDCRRWHGAALGAAGAIDDSVAGARRLAALLVPPVPVRSALPAPGRRHRAG